jgi:hypothetical protein
MPEPLLMLFGDLMPLFPFPFPGAAPPALGDIYFGDGCFTSSVAVGGGGLTGSTSSYTFVGTKGLV